jgi:adenosine deaminase
MEISRELLVSMPKAELHLHLDGAVRAKTLYELAVKADLPIAREGLKAFTPHVQVKRDCRSIGEYLRTFDNFYPLLKDPGALRRIARELCEDKAEEGTRYFEVRMAPVLQATEDFSMEEVVRCVLAGLREGMAGTDVRAGLLLCCYRHNSLESALETVEIAARYLDRGVAGIDLAGDEATYPANLFYPAFQRARELGVPATVHAGEAGSPERVWEALSRLGAMRIGHGLSICEDPKLLRHMRVHRIPIELCITTNLQTCSVPEIQSHPFPRYWKEGLLVTLSTDDPGVSDIDLPYELNLVAREYGLGWEDLKRLTLNSLEAAFLPEDDRTALIAEFSKAFYDLETSGLSRSADG